MKKQERRKQKGITLVALVVTIIVLIILAGVTLNIVLDNDGIINKAKQAAEEYENAQKEEQELLGQLDVYFEYDEQAGVNKPELVEGMIPVKWNGTAWVKADENNTNFDWYQYDTTNKKWANVVTVKETGTKTREQYQQAGVNEVIDEEDIVGMFVWIPRYSYQITNGYHEAANGTGTIEIKFLKGTTDNYEGGTAQRNNKSNEDFVVHPCFTNGATTGYSNGEYNKEITGIWVAKFEASSSEAVKNNSNITNDSPGSVKYGGGNTDDLEVTVRPNVASWRYIDITNMYKVCRAMTKDGNIQGLTRDIDPHLMKGSEWGAVAYLTQSAYGNKQDIDTSTGVWNNAYNECIIWKEKDTGNNYGGVNSYAVTLTGAVGSSRDACTLHYSEQMEITDKTADEITITFLEYAIDGKTTEKTQTYYKYYTTNGVKGSTTGTIYGIYDMSGGAWEQTADYLGEASNQYITYFKGNIKNEHKIEYTGNGLTYSKEDRLINYNANSNRYGDAIWETTNDVNGAFGWNTDVSNFPYLNDPFLMRGGNFTYNSMAGIFAFGSNSGGTQIASFRPVIIP